MPFTVLINKKKVRIELQTVAVLWTLFKTAIYGRCAPLFMPKYDFLFLLLKSSSQVKYELVNINISMFFPQNNYWVNKITESKIEKRTFETNSMQGPKLFVLLPKYLVHLNWNV